MTILSLTDATSFSRVELVNLAKFPNLIALMISTEHSNKSGGVDDRIVKSWKQSSDENDAFQRLKLLVLRGWSGVSTESLQTLRHFPALTFCDLTGSCPTLKPKTRSLIYGWEVSLP